MVLAGELLPPGISLDKSTQVPIFVVGCFVQLFLSNQMEESHNKGTGFGTKTRLKVVTPILACRQDREPQKWAQCASCLGREQERQWVGVLRLLRGVPPLCRGSAEWQLGFPAAATARPAQPTHRRHTTELGKSRRQ